MTTDRQSAIVAGTLFIIADVRGIPSLLLWAPIVSAPDYLVRISANDNRVATSALLALIMAAACAGIGIALYPVLRRYSESLALGSVAFRLIEAVFEIAGAVGLLVLATVSHQFVSDSAADAATFAALATTITASHDWITNVPVPMAWGLGALMYYYVLYRAQLVPRWLAGWGLVGIFGPLVATILVMFGLISAPGHSSAHAEPPGCVAGNRSRAMAHREGLQSFAAKRATAARYDIRGSRKHVGACHGIGPLSPRRGPMPVIR